MKKYISTLVVLFFAVTASWATTPPAYAVGPKALNMDEVAKAIEYPKATNMSGVEGTVLVYVEIDANGSVTNKTVLCTPCPQLKLAVEKAVDDLKFDPAKSAEGLAIASSVRIPFEFELKVD